jgi:hypothetical protein
MWKRNTNPYYTFTEESERCYGYESLITVIVKATGLFLSEMNSMNMFKPTPL